MVYGVEWSSIKLKHDLSIVWIIFSGIFLRADFFSLQLFNSYLNIWSSPESTLSLVGFAGLVSWGTSAGSTSGSMYSQISSPSAITFIVLIQSVQSSIPFRIIIFSSAILLKDFSEC